MRPSADREASTKRTSDTWVAQFNRAAHGVDCEKGYMLAISEIKRAVPRTMLASVDDVASDSGVNSAGQTPCQHSFTGL